MPILPHFLIFIPNSEQKSEDGKHLSIEGISTFLFSSKQTFNSHSHLEDDCQLSCS